MFVSRKKIRLDSVTGDSYNLNIPIKFNASPLDNEDLVKTTFVEKEVEKAINNIIDYKKVRFKPATVKNGKWHVVPEIKIELNFINSDGGYTRYYNGLGFNSEDIFCRINKVMKSYLTLDYYDTTISSENQLLTSTNIYTQMGSDQLNAVGIPKKSDRCPVSYRLGSPTLRPNMVHEGFHIYWFDFDILNTDNKEFIIYLSPTYQNAGNGKVSVMAPYTGNITPLNSKEVQYTKVILKYDNGLFLYTIAANDSRQLKENGGGIDWNDNEDGVPTIRFYEVLNNNSDSAVTDMTEGASDQEKDESVQTQGANFRDQGTIKEVMIEQVDTEDTGGRKTTGGGEF